MAKTSYKLISITEQPQLATGAYAKVYKVVFNYSYTNSETGFSDSYDIHAYAVYYDGFSIDGKGNEYKSTFVHDVLYAFEDRVAGNGKFRFEKRENARRQLNKQFFPKVKNWLKKAGIWEFKRA